eukprot:849384-Pyramimonas_sp.AAC.1
MSYTPELSYTLTLDIPLDTTDVGRSGRTAARRPRHVLLPLDRNTSRLITLLVLLIGAPTATGVETVAVGTTSG